MSDTSTTTTTATTDTGTKTEPPAQGATDADKDWKAEAEKNLREARKWEDRAKENRGHKTELDQLRQSTMSDQDKAVAAARTEADQAAAKRYGQRLVDAEVKAAAAGREVDVEALLEGLDRSRFITDDGEPDTKAITKWLDRIAPAGKQQDPDLGQGARGTAGKNDMNALIRGRMGR